MKQKNFCTSLIIICIIYIIILDDYNVNNQEIYILIILIFIKCFYRTLYYY